MRKPTNYYIYIKHHSALCLCCYFLVTQSCLTLYDPMNCSTSHFPILHYFLEFTSTHVHSMPSKHFILCCPFLLLPFIFPSIRVFFNELVLHMKWKIIGAFSFSISISNEYSGLISFRIDWFYLLAIQGTLKSLL